MGEFALTYAERWSEAAFGKQSRFRWWLVWRAANVLFRVHYWSGLPWRCRLLGHSKPVYRASFIDGIYLEQAWFECGRCEHWMGHA